MFFARRTKLVAQCWHCTKQLKTLTMKTSTKTTVILKAIDLELKALLQQDLKRFKAKNNKQAALKQAA